MLTRVTLIHLAAVAALCLTTLWTALGSQAATIVVDAGRFPSPEVAAQAEGEVNWTDDQTADDDACTHCFAALELQRYLRKMTGDGDGYALAADGQSLAELPAGELILVGGPDTNALSRQVASALGVTPEMTAKLGPEGHVTKSGLVDGRRVMLVAGGGRVGTLYGAYDLLHRLGVRWYAPGEVNEEVSDADLTTLPELDVAESPAFFTRGFHAWEDRGDPDFLLWMARNRLNYWCVEQSQKALMHKLGIMMIGGAHVLTDHYLSPRTAYPYDHPIHEGDEALPKDPYPVSNAWRDANGDGKLSYFEAHPEWYALRGGKRSDNIHGDAGDNFCTSNPHAMAEWMKNAVVDLAVGRYKDAGLMNAWMLDAGKWCECDRCKALGTPTDRNLLFVYEYDRAIKAAQAAGHINRPVRLLFLAYADVLAPPTRPLPADFDYDTCIATYFPIVRCYVHSFDDPGCSRNAGYNKHLKGWAVAPERHYRGQIYIGEYYNVSGYKSLPICFMDTMPSDIPTYYEAGARHFHYMHCTSTNWGNKALTNWQMARQLWDPRVDCGALWNDYFRGRYGSRYSDMRRFYDSLATVLSNVSELKYGLAGRLGAGSANLFPTTHLQYESTPHETNDGPDMADILAAARRCRELIDAVRSRHLPERIAQRVAEDERLFTYGERTVQFYDALCRAWTAARESKLEEARPALAEAQRLAAELKADTTSATGSSSHANAREALEASRAAGALGLLERLVGPVDAAKVPLLRPGGEPLALTGMDFQGGGAVHFGYGLHVFPARTELSKVGNYIYGVGSSCDRMSAWFRLETIPAEGLRLLLVGLKCPRPIGGEVAAEVRVNEQPVFAGKVPFAEDRLTELGITMPAGALKAGVNLLDIINTEPDGNLGSRPWFGLDRVEIREAAR